ncbi:MAG: glycosyltransferase family 4 protein [Magnetococcales bacterium]|nr:glycosyltransferase family 4 protein [Magnetococcales bacterium]
MPDDTFTSDRPLAPAFAVAPWPRTRGGPQVMVRRFIDNARERRYQARPLPLLANHQPCLLNIYHPQQERLFDAPRQVVYRVAGMFLEGHFNRLAEVFGDREFLPAFAAANERIRNALERADFVIYQSRFSKAHLDSLHQRPPGTWEIIPNATPLRLFKPAPQNHRSTNDPPVLGTVGSMRYRPRLEVFFDVARRLPVRPRLLIVGSLDHFCQKVLDEASADPSWQGLIRHVPSVPPSELVSHYQQMDLLLHTVAADSCPNVVVEALACGVPVVCPLEGGSAELVGAGIGADARAGGVAVDDPGGIYGEALRAGMAAGVTEVLGDLTRFRQKARARAEQVCSMDQLAPKYLQALGLPPFGPERGWKYGAVRLTGKLLHPLTRRRITAEEPGNTRGGLDATLSPSPASTPRRRIALTLWDWNLGGIASWMFRLARALPQYEFHFIATHLQAHAPQCDELGRFAYTPTFGSLVRYLRRHRIDLIQVANNRWPVDAAKAAGVPRIIERTDGTRSCCSVSKHDFDQVIVSAAGTAPYIRQFWPKVPIQVVHNAVDLGEVDRVVAQRLAPAEKIVMGRCSRFGHGKRLDLLIEVADTLLQRGYPLRLILAGEDSQLAGAVGVEGLLRQQAAPLGEGVHFTGRSEQPLALAKGFDIGLCASDPFNEGIPNSLIEPMACGKPVVATDVDQVSELVEDGINGFLTPPGDVGAFAEAVERLIVEPELRQKMGRAARRTIEKHYSFDAAIAAYGALYQKLLKPGVPQEEG